MEVIYRFSLDMKKTGIQKTLQGFSVGNDNGQKLVIDLRADGENVVLGENSSAVISITLPSGTVKTAEATIDNNTIEYDVKASDINEDGFTVMQIKISTYDEDLDDTFIVYTPKFALEVN